jgi:hypothetical protein
MSNSHLSYTSANRSGQKKVNGRTICYSKEQKLLKRTKLAHNTAAAADQVGMAKHPFLTSGYKSIMHQQHNAGPAKFWGRLLHETYPSARMTLFAGQLGVKAAQADCEGLEG